MMGGTIAPERAAEIIRAGSQFPHWGNFRKFMTAEEIETVEYHFRTMAGNPSFASIVYRFRNQNMEGMQIA